MSDSIHEFVYRDLGRIGYEDALRIQEELFQHKLDFKMGKRSDNIPDHILFCEHHPVYTLGKNGDPTHLLQQGDASFYRSNRGGDITYHGPGQITGYPIIDLEARHLSLANYIHQMEDAFIRYLANKQIIASRLPDAAGVWLDTEIPAKTRKICAIGVKTSRYISMHGFAFNVNTDLDYFRRIVPCGIPDKGVTSLEKELGTKQDFEAVKVELLPYLTEALRGNEIESRQL